MKVQMRRIAMVGVLMFAGAVYIRFGMDFGLAFGGIGLFVLAGWCAMVDSN